MYCTLARALGLVFVLTPVLAGASVLELIAFQGGRPLPVVVRKQPAGKHAFDRAAVIVIATVREKCEVLRDGTDGQALLPIRFWTYVKAMPSDVVRVNERKADDPDLNRIEFWLEQF